MSSSYVFTDPVTGRTRFFYGYLFVCRGESHHRCPYAFQQGDGTHCTHPNGRSYKCGKPKNPAALP